MNTILAAFLAFAAQAAPAQEEKRPAAAKLAVRVETLTGEADIKSPTGKDWETAKVGMTLDEGTQISTGFNSEMVLVAEGVFRVTLKSLTQVEVTKLLLSDQGVETALKLDIGTMRGHVVKDKVPVKFDVESPVVTASVKGTMWTMRQSSDRGFRVNVMQGTVAVRSLSGGGASVGAGHAAATPRSNALAPGGSVNTGVARTAEVVNSDRSVTLGDVAAQADVRASASSMVPQYAEFSLSDPGVTTSVMSLKALLNSQPSLAPGQAAFAL